MNCLECQELLQDRLDGLALSDQNGLDHHLTGCSSCRAWFTAAQQLEDALGHVIPPAPSIDLAPRIVAAVLADRKKQRALVLRRVWTMAALAASLLLVMVAGDQLGRAPSLKSTPDHEPQPIVTRSLRGSVEDAGSAVASLTRRTADEAMDHGKLLLDVVGVPTGPETTMPPSPIDPPVKSLAVAGQAISIGLEPVANSARRAWGMLLRDVPMTNDEKPGL